MWSILPLYLILHYYLCFVVLKRMIHFYGEDLNELREYVDLLMLPRKYGGTGFPANRESGVFGSVVTWRYKLLSTLCTG